MQVDDGLVVHAESAVAKGVFDSAAICDVLSGGRDHAVVVLAPMALAGGLRVVESDVGLAEQGVGAARAGGVGHADAGLAVDDDVGQGGRGGEGVGDALGDLMGGVHVGDFAQEYGELVSAKASGQVVGA